jgi:hypothetical protein
MQENIRTQKGARKLNDVPAETFAKPIPVPVSSRNLHKNISSS